MGTQAYQNAGDAQVSEIWRTSLHDCDRSVKTSRKRTWSKFDSKREHDTRSMWSCIVPVCIIGSARECCNVEYSLHRMS